jgi:hypothetical protein
MKARRIKKPDLIQNPTQIPAPSYSVGLFKTKPLNFREIANELTEKFKQMDAFGKNLEPGKKDDLFVGVAIVTLTTQNM